MANREGDVRSPYLDALHERIIFFDGAMRTSIQGYDLTAEDFGGKEGCNDYLVLTRPDVIEEIHNSFLEVGCDVVETDTFNASRLRLGEYGLEGRTHEVNVAAARIARHA